MSLINDIFKNNPNITISVSLNDLIEWHREIMQDAKREVEEANNLNNKEAYLTAKQVCDILNIDSSTLWRYGKKGYLSPVNTVGNRRYKKSEVKSILGNG